MARKTGKPFVKEEQRSFTYVCRCYVVLQKSRAGWCETDSSVLGEGVTKELAQILTAFFGELSMT